MEWKNGNRFIGEFENNEIVHGNMFYQKGDYYVGDF